MELIREFLLVNFAVGFVSMDLDLVVVVRERVFDFFASYNWIGAPCEETPGRETTFELELEGHGAVVCICHCNCVIVVRNRALHR